MKVTEFNVGPVCRCAKLSLFLFCVPSDTKRNTKYAVSLFRKWLTSRFGTNYRQQNALRHPYKDIIETMIILIPHFLTGNSQGQRLPSQTRKFNQSKQKKKGLGRKRERLLSF